MLGSAMGRFLRRPNLPRNWNMLRVGGFAAGRSQNLLVRAWSPRLSTPTSRCTQLAAAGVHWSLASLNILAAEPLRPIVRKLGLQSRRLASAALPAHQVSCVVLCIRASPAWRTFSRWRGPSVGTQSLGHRSLFWFLNSMFLATLLPCSGKMESLICGLRGERVGLANGGIRGNSTQSQDASVAKRNFSP
jgi:hypothetical protein